MAGEVRRVRPGQPLQPGWHNNMLDHIERAATVRVEPPLESVRTHDETLIRLRRDAQTTLDAEIVAVSGASPGVPDSITYDVRPIGVNESTRSSMMPRYGRPHQGAANPRIVAAAVGDRCRMHRRKQPDGTWIEELEILSERLHFTPCPAQVLNS